MIEFLETDAENDISVTKFLDQAFQAYLQWTGETRPSTTHLADKYWEAKAKSQAMAKVSQETAVRAPVTTWKARE